MTEQRALAAPRTRQCGKMKRQQVLDAHVWIWNMRRRRAHFEPWTLLARGRVEDDAAPEYDDADSEHFEPNERTPDDERGLGGIAFTGVSGADLEALALGGAAWATPSAVSSALVPPLAGVPPRLVL